MYEYVQHDNEFCLSCHLMVDPYERFARSEHRDLGCKACHQPTLLARSKMALTQIIENPEELQTHAEVPNERCEACHIKGDPERWKQVASTAGHRVHFESPHKALEGLQCVECHSSSLHEFAATDKTCGQSGCHENTQIQLGKMGQLTMHCAACHEFNRPVAQTVRADSLHGALTPRGEECLSCHAMRQLVAEQFTADDPHNAQCGACHNPHEQRTPREAVNSCANSGCHSRADTITPMHVGLPATVMQDCVQCHVAHRFAVRGNQCLDCHRDVFEGNGNGQGQGKGAGAGAGARAADVQVVRYVHVTQQSPQTSNRAFSHNRHRNVQCQSCHDSSRSHGAITVRTARDCQSCHHGNQQVAANCTGCHERNEFGNQRYTVAQRFNLSAGAGRTVTRNTGFTHEPHEQIACAQCHRDPLTRSTTDLQCNSCHQDHHKPTASCMSCHPPARAGAHNRNVHVGCGGSGCHSELPVVSVPRTRAFCLACHQDMVNHQPRGNCADCHRLPPPRQASAN